MDSMTKKCLCLPAVAILALPLIHPFGPVRQERSSVLLPGVQDPQVLALMEKACQNCHSERTQWPFYSYLPLASWALEKDVADGRQHMDLSRWDQYPVESKRDLLARIGTEVRNRQMPLPRYLLLHPEARLTDAEIQFVYDWTKAERRTLRK
jgi:cytochrome c